MILALTKAVRIWASCSASDRGNGIVRIDCRHYSGRMREVKSHTASAANGARVASAPLHGLGRSRRDREHERARLAHDGMHATGRTAGVVARAALPESSVTLPSSTKICSSPSWRCRGWWRRLVTHQDSLVKAVRIFQSTFQNTRADARSRPPSGRRRRG
jgi:hypothetical protein